MVCHMTSPETDFKSQTAAAGEQFVIESDGLLVRNVRRTDAGTYTCRARVPQTGELEERDIRLDVQVVIVIVIVKDGHDCHCQGDFNAALIMRIKNRDNK